MAFKLIPKEERFFEDFIAVRRGDPPGRGLLEEMLAPDQPLWDKADEIKAVEDTCDAMTHGIIQRLYRTFVTPLDREDIFELARSLDDVVDAIDAAAALVRLYQLQVVRPDARILARIIMRSADQIVVALEALEKKVGVRRRRSRSIGWRTRPIAPIRPACTAVRGGARSDRDHQVEGDPGPARGGHGSLRGRRRTSWKAW